MAARCPLWEVQHLCYILQIFLLTLLPLYRRIKIECFLQFSTSFYYLDPDFFSKASIAMNLSYGLNWKWAMINS